MFLRLLDSQPPIIIGLVFVVPTKNSYCRKSWWYFWLLVGACSFVGNTSAKSVDLTSGHNLYFLSMLLLVFCIFLSACPLCWMSSRGWRRWELLPGSHSKLLALGDPNPQVEKHWCRPLSSVGCSHKRCNEMRHCSAANYNRHHPSTQSWGGKVFT